MKNTLISLCVMLFCVGHIAPASTAARDFLSIEVRSGRDAYDIELGPQDTVPTLKQKMERLTKIPAGEQQLFFHGQELRDNDPLLGHFPNRTRIVLRHKKTEEGPAEADRLSRDSGIPKLITPGGPRELPAAAAAVADEARSKADIARIAHLEREVHSCQIQLKAKDDAIARLTKQLKEQEDLVKSLLPH